MDRVSGNVETCHNVTSYSTSSCAFGPLVFAAPLVPLCTKMSSSSVPQTPVNSTAFPTRTLAIIKPHAVKHRLTIERRIVEAGFEIIKERQMQFDPDVDRDTLIELFERDADSLSLCVTLAGPFVCLRLTQPQGSCVGVRARTQTGGRGVEHAHGS